MGGQFWWLYIKFLLIKSSLSIDIMRRHHRYYLRLHFGLSCGHFPGFFPQFSTISWPKWLERDACGWLRDSNQSDFNGGGDSGALTVLSSARSPPVILTLCVHHEMASLCQGGGARPVYFVRRHSG